ncbi:hypothetical protein Tco_0275954 [Tanacetum coccineum]
MAYNDKYKKVLDEIWKDKVELDGMIVKEEEEAINKVKGEALKEKDDPEAFIFPIRFEGKIKKCISRHWVGVTTIIAKFLILDIPIDRDAPIVVVRGFLYKIGGIVNTQKDFSQLLMESAIKLFVPQDPILWEETMMKPDNQNPNALDDTKPWKRYCFYKFIMNSYYGKVATKRQSLEINDMLRIKLREVGSNEEILTSVAWIRAFNINETIYSELCHEFYSAYEFNEVCADDELQTKKIIKFRLGGRTHSLTLLEFACRLRLYHADELDEEGFDVYFQGGLHNFDTKHL